MSTNYYQEHQPEFLEDLKKFLRIPSISALSEHAGDVERCAQFVAGQLEKAGLEGVRMIRGEGNPLVYAEWLHAEGKPTLLVYGHYDVQPPDPLDEWKSPPFDPEIRDGNIFARGASDDKGQTLLLIKAVEGFLRAGQPLPVNLRFLIEGEEEVSGRHIESYVGENAGALSCDAALICDTEMFAPDLPTLCVGLRGIVYTEILLTGARQDLHSGVYGGAAPNPLQAAAEIICALKDREGVVQIPHFYNRVEPMSQQETAAMARLPFDEKHFRETEMGVSALAGEKDHPVLVRLWARPTLEVHGIKGGFTGEGAKTVIPARATVKVSMRLVPDQRPEEIVENYRKAVEAACPAGIHAEVRVLGASPASVVNPDSRFIQAAAEAMTEVFGTETVYIRSGGSIPIVGVFNQRLKVPSVLMGFGLPDDNIHSPNEKLHLANFYRGMEAVARYFEILGARNNDPARVS